MRLFLAFFNLNKLSRKNRQAILFFFLIYAWILFLGSLNSIAAENEPEPDPPLSLGLQEQIIGGLIVTAISSFIAINVSGHNKAKFKEEHDLTLNQINTKLLLLTQRMDSFEKRMEILVKKFEERDKNQVAKIKAIELHLTRHDQTFNPKDTLF